MRGTVRWIGVLGVVLLGMAAPVGVMADVGAADIPPLVLVCVHGGARYVLRPTSPEGGFGEAARQRAQEAFAWRVDGARHPIEPTLLDRVYRTMRHFDAPRVELVSGYREDRWGSRHTHGRAIDMRLPGVKTIRLAQYARTLGFGGVGIYPREHFVHMDVRQKSAFWVDYSRPGRSFHPKTILRGLAMRMDRQARARGEAPISPLPPEPPAMPEEPAMRGAIARNR